MSIQRSTSFQYEYKGDLQSPANFYTYKIEGRKVTVDPFSEKTAGKGRALASLKTIEKIVEGIREGEYEPFSLENLQKQADEIYQAYQRKIESFSWLRRQVSGVEKKKKEIEKVYQKISALAQTQFEELPWDVLERIYDRLTEKDLLKLQGLNHHFQEFFQPHSYQTAVILGYKGPQTNAGISNFLKNISEEMLSLHAKGALPKEIRCFEPDSNKLDPFKTYDNLKKMSNAQVLQLFVSHKKSIAKSPYVREKIFELVKQHPADSKISTKYERKRALFYFAEKNCPDAVETLLLLGLDVNRLNSNHQTLLYKAVKKGHQEVIKVLLKYKADPDLTDINSIGPISLVISKGDKVTLGLLLNHGGSSNHLHTAFRYEASLDIFKLLIEKGADVNIENSWGWTALMYAIIYGKKDVAKLLIEQPNLRLDEERWYDHNTALHLALRHGHTEIAELLVRKGADCTIRNGDGLAAYKMANRSGFTSLVEWMLFHNPHLVINDNLRNQDRLLDYAIERGHERVVLRLKGLQEQDGADDVTTWATILREGQLSDKMKEKALQQAVIDGNLELIKFFIAKGISLEGVNDDGNTLLHIAARNGQTEVVKYLISLKPRGWKWDVGGMTPVSYAMANNHQELGLLLSHHQLALTS